MKHRLNTILKKKGLLSYVFLIVLNIVLFLSNAVDARFTSTQHSPSRFLDVKESTYLLNGKSNRCTANLISNNGHFITARHCLQRCLIPNGIFKPSNNAPDGTTYFELDTKSLGFATCDVTLNKVQQTVTIEATSPGLILKMDELSFKILAPELFSQLVDEGFTSEGDFVIFKSTRHANLNHCIPLTKENENFKTKNHHVFSYPSATDRSDDFNSDGQQMYYSQGTFRNSILENSCIDVNSLSEFHSKDITSRFGFESSFLTSVDAIFGSSGSIVFDDDSQSLGILINTFNYASISRVDSDKPENRFCEGSSKVLKASTILKSLAKLNFDLNEIRCSSKNTEELMASN